ncbi:MAG: HAD family hydrolase [Flavobacteriales bacterium]|nr:HAD family hydrolase [Flavobacteriales bacterium]
MIKAILFDFDGVILDSLEVKTQAFYEMYLPYGVAMAERVKTHHLQHGGISRFEKFKLYHDEWLGIPTDESKIYELANEFSRRVFEGVVNAPEVKGIRSFLEANYHRYRIWVITGTPTEEIQEIVKAVQMDNYFEACYGSPEKKTYWTAKIIKDEKLKPEEVLFVGDALADYEAAQVNGTHFLLRKHADNEALFAPYNLSFIYDFVDFEAYLKRLNEA